MVEMEYQKFHVITMQGCNKVGTKKNLETSVASKHIGHTILSMHRHGTDTCIQKHRENKSGIPY